MQLIYLEAGQYLHLSLLVCHINSHALIIIAKINNINSCLLMPLLADLPVCIGIHCRPIIQTISTPDY